MSFAIQPTTEHFLQTQRLYMRPVDADHDLPECIDLYARKEENRLFESGPKTEVETARYVDQFATRQFRNFPPFGIYAVFRKEDHVFIGHADLFTIDQEQMGDVEIGFILKKEFQGQGYGFEIALALKNYAYDLSLHHPRVKRMVATAHPDNVPSWKILEKLGMQFVGQEEKFNGLRKVYKLEFLKPEQV